MNRRRGNSGYTKSGSSPGWERKRKTINVDFGKIEKHSISKPKYHYTIKENVNPLGAFYSTVQRAISVEAEIYKKEWEQERAAEYAKLYRGIKAVLTDKENEAIDLKFGLTSRSGLTERQVAAMLGISKGAVHDRLGSAINKLREYFEQ